MKKLILITLLSLSLFSCSTEQELYVAPQDYIVLKQNISIPCVEVILLDIDGIYYHYQITYYDNPIQVESGYTTIKIQEGLSCQ